MYSVILETEEFSVELDFRLSKISNDGSVSRASSQSSSHFSKIHFSPQIFLQHTQQNLLDCQNIYKIVSNYVFGCLIKELVTSHCNCFGSMSSTNCHFTIDGCKGFSTNIFRSIMFHLSNQTISKALKLHPPADKCGYTS